VSTSENVPNIADEFLGVKVGSFDVETTNDADSGKTVSLLALLSKKRISQKKYVKLNLRDENFSRYQTLNYFIFLLCTVCNHISLA